MNNNKKLKFKKSYASKKKKNNLTIARGEWGMDSGERGFRNYYKGYMDNQGGGRWVQLGWGGGMGRKGTQL